MHFRFITSLLILTLISGTSWAQNVLVERLPDPALTGGGVAGGMFTDRPGEEVSPLTVVTFAEEVNITSITIFMTNLFENYPVGSSGTAILNIFVGSELGINDDTLSGGPFGNASQPVDYVATANGLEITASGLDITLPGTTFLIGMTPILNFGTNGQEFIQDAGVNGQTTFLDNEGGAFFNPVFGMATINSNIVDLPTDYTGMAIRILSGSVLKGDVNGDGEINLLDVGPFVDALSSGTYIPEADTNCDGELNLLDVGPFIDLLSG